MPDFEEYLAEVRTHLGVDPGRADEIVAELRTHLESRAAQLQNSGMNRGQAVDDAVRRFGDPTAVARRLAEASGRCRSVGALRALGSMAVLCGTIVVVVGGSDVWDRSLTRWLVDAFRFGEETAMYVALLALIAPAAVLSGMLAGQRYGWVPGVAPSLLYVVFVIVISWAELLVGQWEEVAGALIPLSLALLVGACALVGSRLTFGTRGRYLVSAVAAVYFLGLAAAKIACIRDAVGALATIAVIEVIVGILGLAAVWDRYGWRSSILWVGGLLCVVSVVVMAVLGTHPPFQSDVASAKSYWMIVVLGEATAWIALLTCYWIASRKTDLTSGAPMQVS